MASEESASTIDWNTASKMMYVAAIDTILARRILLNPGDIASHNSLGYAHTFIKYEDGNAVLQDNHDPKASLALPMWEVYDANAVKLEHLRLVTAWFQQQKVAAGDISTPIF